MSDTLVNSIFDAALRMVTDAVYGELIERIKEFADKDPEVVKQWIRLGVHDAAHRQLLKGGG